MVVSMGARGALFVSHDEVVASRPPCTVVRSTVGCGDAMVAGIVAARLQGLSLTQTATLATAFSVEAVTRIGAGLTSKGAVEMLAREIKVDRR